MAKRKELNCIKVVLRSQGRSQSWLADKMGKKYNTVNGWCNNRNQPYLSEIVKMAEILEVAPADLIVDGAKKEGQTISLTSVN